LQQGVAVRMGAGPPRQRLETLGGQRLQRVLQFGLAAQGAAQSHQIARPGGT
jgi:hypothetical protein